MGCGSSTIEPVIDPEVEARRLLALERLKRRICLTTLRSLEEERRDAERSMLYNRVPASQAMYYYLRQLTEESNRYPDLFAALAKPGLLFRRLSAVEMDTKLYQMNFLPPSLTVMNPVQIHPAKRLEDEISWGVHDYQMPDLDAKSAQLYARSFDRKLTIDSLPFPMWGIIDGPEPPRDVIVKLADEVQKVLREQRADIDGSAAGAAFDYHHILCLLAKLRLEQSALRSVAKNSMVFNSNDLLSARAKRALAQSTQNMGNSDLTSGSKGVDALSISPRNTSTFDVLAELSTSNGARKIKAARSYALWLDYHLKQLGLPILFDAPSCLLPSPKVTPKKEPQQSLRSKSGEPLAPVPRRVEDSRPNASDLRSNMDDGKDSQNEATVIVEDKITTNQGANPSKSMNPEANIQAIAKRAQGLLEAADWESFYLCLPMSLTSRMTVSSFSAAMSRVGEVLSATYTINSIDALPELSVDQILAQCKPKVNVNEIEGSNPPLHPAVAKIPDSEIDNTTFELAKDCFPDQKLLRSQLHEPSWEIVFTLESCVLLEQITSRLVLHVPKAADTPQAPLQNGSRSSNSEPSLSPVTGFGFPVLVKTSTLSPPAISHIVSSDSTKPLEAASKRFALVPALNETVVGHRRYVFTAPAGRPFVVGCVLPPHEGSYTLGSFSVTCSNPTYQSIILPDLNPHSPAGSGICALYCVGPCDVVIEIEYVSAPSRLVWTTPACISELGGHAEDPELAFSEPVNELDAVSHLPRVASPAPSESYDTLSPPTNGFDARASAMMSMPFLSTRAATNNHIKSIPAHKLWPRALQFPDTYEHFRALPGQDSSQFKTWLANCKSDIVRKRQSELSIANMSSDSKAMTSTAGSTGGHQRTFTFGSSGRNVGSHQIGELPNTMDGQTCVLLAYELYKHLVETLYLLPSEETLGNVSLVLSREPDLPSNLVTSLTSSEGMAGKIGASASDLCDIYVAVLRSLQIPTRYVRCVGSTFVQFLAIGEGLGWVTVDVPILQPLLFGSVHSCEPRLCVSKNPLIDASRLLTDSAASRSLADETLSAAELFATLMHDPAAGDPREAVHELFAPEVLKQQALVANLMSTLTKVAKLGPFPENRRYIRVSGNSTRVAIYQETARPGGGSVRWLLAWKSHRIVDIKIALCGGISSAEAIPTQFQLSKPEDMSLTSDGTQLVVASWANEAQELNTWREKLADVRARYNWEALVSLSTPTMAGPPMSMINGTQGSISLNVSSPRSGMNMLPVTPSSRAGDGNAVKVRLPPTAISPVVVESGGLFAWPVGSQHQLASAAAIAPTKLSSPTARSFDSPASPTAASLNQADSLTPDEPESLLTMTQESIGEVLRAAEMNLDYTTNWTIEDVSTSPGVILKMPECNLKYHISL